MQEDKATGWDFTYLTNTGRMMESPLVTGSSDLSVATVLQVKANEEFLHWNLGYALQEFVPTAFKISFKAADTGFMRFYDPEALLFYIRSMPYLFEDYDSFDFSKIAVLLKNYFSAHHYLDIQKDRFLIVAQK
jgi:hypothetical protein